MTFFFLRYKLTICCTLFISRNLKSSPQIVLNALVDTEAEESLVMFGGAAVLHSAYRAFNTLLVDTEAEESLVMFGGAAVLHSAYLHSTLYW